MQISKSATGLICSCSMFFASLQIDWSVIFGHELVSQLSWLEDLGQRRTTSFFDPDVHPGSNLVPTNTGMFARLREPTHDYIYIVDVIIECHSVTASQPCPNGVLTRPRHPLDPLDHHGIRPGSLGMACVACVARTGSMLLGDV